MTLALIGRRSSPRLWLISSLGLALTALLAAFALRNHLPPLLGASLTPTTSPHEKPTGPLEVTLAEGKLKVAGIHSEPGRVESLSTEVVVAGTIEANPNRRVEIRPRVAGVVRSVNVTPSQRVEAGSVLAILDSAEVGTARLNLRARQLDLSIDRTEAEWKSMTASNIDVLIPELRKGTSAAALEKRFADKALGAHRGELFSAYADYEIASHEERKQTDLFGRKIVGEHPYFLAIHTRESAQAKLEAALEQIRFDAAQEKRLADQQVRLAEAAVVDAAKRLQIMGVPEAQADPLAGAEEVSAEATAAEDVTAYPLIAPFAGTVLDVSAVFSQRAEPTDVLMTLADLSTVRAVAALNESDLAALASPTGGTVRVMAAAYPGRSFEAKVLYTGAEVDPETRRVRLVAEAANPDGLLRLGMFVRIRLEHPDAEPVLTVPASSIVEVDGRPAVFVPDPTGRTFALRPVEPGRSALDRREIRAGLAPGEPVVSAGAFLIKSELILQNEPEEE